MKLGERISWLMGYVQKTLLPHPDECLDIPLTKHEQHLAAILEIAEAEKYVIRRSAVQWLGRKLLTREAVARAYAAKAFYRHPATRNLIRALQSSVSLRLICGFKALGDIPPEAAFSRAFKEFSESALGERVHDALVQDYPADEIIGHISRDSTAAVGHEKPAEKTKKAKKPLKRGRPAKGENGNRQKPDLHGKPASQLKKRLPNCQQSAAGEPRRMPKGIKHPGMAASCIWMSMMPVCRSVSWLLQLQFMTAGIPQLH